MIKALKLTPEEKFALERAMVPYVEKWDHWTYGIGPAHSRPLLKRLCQRGLIERYTAVGYEYKLTEFGYTVLSGIERERLWGSRI